MATLTADCADQATPQPIRRRWEAPAIVLERSLEVARRVVHRSPAACRAGFWGPGHLWRPLPSGDYGVARAQLGAPTIWVLRDQVPARTCFSISEGWTR